MKNIIVASFIGIAAIALAANTATQPTSKPTTQASQPTTASQPTSKPTTKYATLDLKNLHQGQIGELPEGGIVTWVGTKKGNMGVSITYPDGTKFFWNKPEQEFKVGDKFAITGPWRIGKQMGLRNQDGSPNFTWPITLAR